MKRTIKPINARSGGDGNGPLLLVVGRDQEIKTSKHVMIICASLVRRAGILDSTRFLMWVKVSEDWRHSQLCFLRQKRANNKKLSKRWINQRTESRIQN